MTDFNQLQLIEQLYPLHRTLVSDDIDKTLKIIEEVLPGRFRSDFSLVSIPSGTKCWTWTAPKKYTVRKAFIETMTGERIADFDCNALHLVSYSQPVNAVMTFDELDPHLHFSKKRPGAIPWKFSYYSETWGFCIPYHEYECMDRSAQYRVVIDSIFEDDALKIGELLIKGDSPKELLIITNICHPYQVNDSISGVTAVLEMLYKMSDYAFNKSLRILFLPETIGSICYFASNMEVVENIEYGIFTEMLGNEGSIALQYSFQANSLIDKIAESTLQKTVSEYRTGEFRSIVGNDELVSNGPGLNIPTISISRSKRTLDSYPEYHTSDDNPSMLLEENLIEAADILRRIVTTFDEDYRPKRKFAGPVFLSGYDLWGVWGDIKEGKEFVDKIMYRLEGDLTVFEISEAIGLNFEDTKRIVDAFLEKGLVEKI